MNERPNQPTHVRYAVVAWLCAAAAIAYLHRNSISVAESTIREELVIGRIPMSYAMSSFFWTYALFQIPLGAWGDRIGNLRALTWLFGMCCGGVALIAIAQNLFVLMLGRLVLGFGQAGLFPCSIALLAQWMPKRQRTLSSGLIASSMQVGAGAATYFTGRLLGVGLGWRTTFLLYLLPGVVWTAFRPWLRDRPDQHPKVNEAERRLIKADENLPPARGDPGAPGLPPGEGPANGPEPVERAEGAEPVEGAKSPEHIEGGKGKFRDTIPRAARFALAALCMQQFLRAGGSVFFASWFPTVLQDTRGISIKDAGALASLPLLGSGLGALLGGGVSDWLLSLTGNRRVSRQGLAVVSLLACTALIVPTFSLAKPVAGEKISPEKSDREPEAPNLPLPPGEGRGEGVFPSGKGPANGPEPIEEGEGKINMTEPAVITPETRLAVYLLSLGTFWAAFCGPAAYATAMDLGGKNVATIFGAMNMCGNIGAALFPIAAAVLRDQTGSWTSVFVLFMSIHLVAAVCWLFADADAGRRIFPSPSGRGPASGPELGRGE